MKKKILIWLFKGPYGIKIINHLKKKIKIYHHVDFNNNNDLPLLSMNYDFLISKYNPKKNSFNQNKLLQEIFLKNFETWKNYMFSRFNFDGLNFLDLETICKCQILFFYDYLLKSKINFLIMGPNFGWGSDYLFYVMAKKLNIKTLLIKNTFRDRFFYSYDFEDWGYFKNKKKEFKQIKAKNYINTDKTDFWYMKNKFYLQKKFGLSIFFPFLNGLKEYGLSRELIKNNIKEFLAFRENYKKYSFWRNEQKRPFLSKNLPKKYVLFALHFQPESSTMSFGNNYLDQLKAIEELSFKLPKEYKILVKDHARQSNYLHRSSIFYKRIESLDNVEMTNINDDVKILIKNASCIATITGIIGFEGINKGKPVITFGKAWYNFLPYVFNWNKKINIRKILKKKVIKSKVEKKISLFTKTMPSGVLYEKWGRKAYDFTTKFQKKDFKSDQEAKLVATSIIKIINYN